MPRPAPGLQTLWQVKSIVLRMINQLDIRRPAARKLTRAPVRIQAVASLLLMWLVPAHALDTLTAGQLADDCLRSGEVPSGCVAYVRGFIDGALATDPRVAINVEREIARDESFSERAFRTRLGPRMDRYGPSYFADFCIPNPVPIQEIVASLVEELRELSDRGEPAREFVYRQLRRAYPCEIPDD